MRKIIISMDGSSIVNVDYVVDVKKWKYGIEANLTNKTGMWFVSDVDEEFCKEVYKKLIAFLDDKNEETLLDISKMGGEKHMLMRC